MTSAIELLLGMPRRGRARGEVALAGRAQVPWGRWWERHPRLLRSLALLALVWMLVYLVWRVGWSWQDANPWLGGALLVAELFGLWNLSTLSWFSRPAAPLPAVASNQPSVDVYICSYDEPLSVVRSTLVGCAALRYPHTTYVLDDGRRAEIARLAAKWEAHYIVRADNAHAKAGNINNALEQTTGELVLTLDADHVPLPGALDALVGYFGDPCVALVQTPHDFYNHDSFQHYEVGRHEQSVFYSVILPGKARHGGAFWCGSGALIRREALLAIGGVATETIAEDFHTTIKLQRAGWVTRYHDEVLIQGLAPHDLASYLLQRDRWARGNLAVFTTPESPLRARELSFAQRLSYLASLCSYLAGPMRLLSLLVLSAVIWSGQLPLNATLPALAALWGPATILSLSAGSALCRGYQSIADTTHFELCTAEIYARALRCALRPGRASFRVTPKEGIDLGGFAALRQLHAVSILTVLLGCGLVLRLIEEIGGVPLLPSLHGIAFWVVPVIAALELRRMLRTLAMVASRHQLRREYRVPLQGRVVLDPGPELQDHSSTAADMIGTSCDVSTSGIRVRTRVALEPGTTTTATLALPDSRGESSVVQLPLVVRSCRADGNRYLVGARITQPADADLRRLLEYCYVVSAQRRLRQLSEPADARRALKRTLASWPLLDQLPAAAGTASG